MEENSKSKGKFFGGSKKTETLVERMQLVESVASASLDVMNELVEMGGSAVREVESGLLIVVITNDMLVASAVDPTSEDFGSFAQALQSESIDSITLAEDLADGIIGIIPSMDTLISLDEFEFIQDMPLQWAVVPFDLTDESRLRLLDSTVHLDRLMEIAKSSSIELHLEGNVVVDNGDSEPTWAEEDDDREGNEEREQDSDLHTESDNNDPYFEPTGSDGEYDVFSSENNSTYSDTSDNERTDYSGSDFYGEFGKDGDDLDEEEDQDFRDEDPEDDLDVGDSSLESSLQQSSLTSEESKEAVSKALEHSFNNSELNLHIDLSKFDDYFGSLSVVRFDDKPTDESELERVVSNFRKDANAEIEKFHEIEIGSLRNVYVSKLRELHSSLVEVLDHTNQSTIYGARFAEIDVAFDASMTDMDRASANEIKLINQNYNEERETYGENAKREAMTVYDTRYRDERNRKIEGVKDALKSDVKLTRDVARGELYHDRRVVAATLYDKALTELMQKLQDEYQTIMEKELQMFDTFRQKIELYYREHFSDEVLRAKAEAERLKQNDEAALIRSEFEKVLEAKNLLLLEADSQARFAIEQLEDKHQEQLRELKSDYERNMQREKSEIENLRNSLQSVTESSTKIGETKDKEVKHRLKMYEDQIEAQRQELSYANERAGKGFKQFSLVCVAIGAAALAIGILFGFVFGANSAHQQAPGAPAAQMQPVSMSHGAAVPSFGIEHLNEGTA